MTERIINAPKKPLEWNGTKYRSQLEVDTAKVLTALGLPFEYEKKVITLQEGFRCPYQKDRVRSLKYTPDFMIGSIMLECKGFETPEWQIKRKLLYKYLMENEPDIIFHQIHDARKELLLALDGHWSYLGYCIEVSPQPKKKKSLRLVRDESSITKYESIQQAMEELKLYGKAIGPILHSLTGTKPYVYGYHWQLSKIIL